MTCFLNKFIFQIERKDGAEVTLDDEFNVDLDEAERLAAATSTSKSNEDRPAKNYTRDTKVTLFIYISSIEWVVINIFSRTRTQNIH